MKNKKLDFDSDTKALKQREQLNTRGALYDLEDWIIKQVNPYQGMRVLDLGCGTGKQIFALADFVSSDGFILGFDIADEAINEINKRAKKEQRNQIKTIRGALDECIDLLRDSRFDLIISTYAIYYARDMKKVLSGLGAILNPRGHIFVCGPGRGTNQEIFKLINKIVPNSSLKVKHVTDFIQKSEIKKIGKHYSRFSTVQLANKIQFDSVESVLQWWKNHNSFIPEIYDTVAKTLQSCFVKKNKFILTKNVLGIHYYV